MRVLSEGFRLEFLVDYGTFLVKSVTVVAALLVVVSGMVAIASKPKRGAHGFLEVTKLNDKFQEMKEMLEYHVMDKHSLKARHKSEKKEEKARDKAMAKKVKAGELPEARKKHLYVLDFNGDIRASAVDSLRQAISGLLQVADADNDEVVVKLESGGGMVHSYGLASAQLQRIKDHGLKLTVCVDKVAASGGYMMACVADKIVASPFAVLGSIGVVAQIPNVHRLLKKNDIDVEVLTAGEFKRTLTVFGENTDKGRQKFIKDLEDTHVLFKEFVNEHRPVVDIEKVATGDVWFGRRALDVKLVDELVTSDAYLMQACKEATVYEIKFVERKSIPEKLGLAASVGVEGAIERAWGRLTARHSL